MTAGTEAEILAQWSDELAKAL
ncbi:MAG: hypothetical protein K0S72_869, partial [Arthrobacter sp.]|nr:hypothetical protein [Arthrobacter sp.]